MGYNAEWSFNIEIPAAKVAEATLTAAKAIDRHTYDDDDNEIVTETLVELFEQVFGCDCDAFFEEQTPLQQLADAANPEQTVGAFKVEGYAHGKWRDDEEPMLEAIAPYVKAGSTVHVRGEDYDCPDEWVYTDGKLDKSGSVVIRRRRHEELEAKEKKLDKLLPLVTEYLDLRSKMTDGTRLGRLRRQLTDVLSDKEPSALTQLAEVAE